MNSSINRRKINYLIFCLTIVLVLTQSMNCSIEPIQSIIIDIFMIIYMGFIIYIRYFIIFESSSSIVYFNLDDRNVTKVKKLFIISPIIILLYCMCYLL